MNKIKVANTWRNISVPYTRVNGTWKPCKQMWVKVNGTWRVAFDLTEPDPFDGTGTLDQTPGNVPWEQLSGTWTKSSGLVTSSDSSNRLASVDAGTSDITINIDADDVNKSGEGVAFWIQDQLNWWGLKTFYNYFSFSTPSTPTNHECTNTWRNQVLTNSTKTAFLVIPTNYSVATTGYNYTENRFLTRFCSCTNGTVTVPATTSTNCASSCSGFSFPTCSKSSCGTQNQRFCAGACASGSCPAGPANTILSAYTSCANGNTNCPATSSVVNNFTGNLGSKCSLTTTYNYNCSFQTCSSCTYAFVFSSVSNNYFDLGYATNANCTGPAGTTYVNTRTCVAKTNPVPPTVTFVYETQLQLIRSQAGSVNVVNSQSYSNMGNVYAATSGNTITARAYSSTGQTGTLYGPWTYDAGSVPKGNKHGILISSVPYQQTFSISRFKADL